MATSSSSDIGRISIERVDDWNRIQAKFTESMFDVLNNRLAQSSSQHVRDAVTAYLQEWRDRTFAAARENIRVNGHNLEDYVEEEEETEPFDEALDRRIWTLSTERMTWDKELAERRRAAPFQVQSLLQDLLERQRTAEYVPPPVDDNIELDTSDSRLAREKDVSATFHETSNLLENLRMTVPQILERTDRATEVAEQIKNLPS